MGAPLLGRGLIRFWIGIQMVNALIRYLSAVLLLPAFGAYALAGGTLVGMLFDLTAYSIVCRQYIGVCFPGRDLQVFVVGGAAVICASFVGSSGSHPVAFTAVACVLLFVTAAMARGMLGWLAHRFGLRKPS